MTRKQPNPPPAGATRPPPPPRKTCSCDLCELFKTNLEEKIQQKKKKKPAYTTKLVMKKAHGASNVAKNLTSQCIKASEQGSHSLCWIFKK